MQIRQDRLKISNGILRTKPQWVLMENQSNLSEKNFPRIYNIDVSQGNPEGLGKNCISIAEKVKNYSKRCLPGHWIFLGPGSEKRWHGGSYDGQWDRAADKMVQLFKEIGHPTFTATSAFESRKSEARNVRRLKIATGQYPSFCGCALGLVLGDLDNMGVEVQDREQVEVREKVEARETEEEDKTRKQQTVRHVMTCG